jgi:hypothetical protein
VVAAVVNALLHHQVLEHVSMEVEGAPGHLQHTAGPARPHLHIQQPPAVQVKQVVAVTHSLQSSSKVNCVLLNAAFAGLAMISVREIYAVLEAPLLGHDAQFCT